jgi:phage terminase large subunit-like protein
MVAFGQGYASMNWPTKKLEEVVLSGRLRHGGNPVLRWMAGNVSLETDAAEKWKPSKKNRRERIDGIARPTLFRLGQRELSFENDVDHSALRGARNWNLAVRRPDCNLVNSDQLNAILYRN